jgi:hypothetical protein
MKKSSGLLVFYQVHVCSWFATPCFSSLIFFVGDGSVLQRSIQAAEDLIM